MNLHKRLLLLNHLDNFISEQFSIGQTTDDVIGMIRYKVEKYREKESSSSTSGVRKTYLENYILILNKRIIDYQYFRKKEDLSSFPDTKIFKLLHNRDRIIFKKIFKD